MAAPKLTGGANALTRGKGNKFGLKRKMGVPTGSKRTVPPIVKPPTPPTTGTKVVSYPSEGPRMVELAGATPPAFHAMREVPIGRLPSGAPSATAPKPRPMPWQGMGGSPLTKAIAAATAKKKGRANALTRGKGRKLGLKRITSMVGKVRTKRKKT